MKKISWGTGIAIVIVVFLLFTILQVLIIHFYVDYDLVEQDYYSAEIKYQTQIDKINRTNQLPEQLSIKLTLNTVEFSFPTFFGQEKVSGVISYYKPSDDLLDKKQTINLNNENKMFLNINELSSGLWKIKVDWAVSGVEYFNDKLIMVP